MRPEGHGGGGWRWSSAGTAETEMAPMELEAYFAKQLEAAGWGRMDGSADETFAWSSWLIPDSGEWRGVLIVLAAFPGNDLRVDQHPRLITFLGHVEDQQLLVHVDLGRGEADARRGVHGLEHVIDQGLQGRIEHGDRFV